MKNINSYFHLLPAVFPGYSPQLLQLNFSYDSGAPPGFCFHLV